MRVRCLYTGRTTVQRVVCIGVEDVRNPVLWTVSVPRLGEHGCSESFRQALRHHKPARRLRAHDVRQGNDRTALLFAISPSATSTAAAAVP